MKSLKQFLIEGVVSDFNRYAEYFSIAQYIGTDSLAVWIKDRLFLISLDDKISLYIDSEFANPEAKASLDRILNAIDGMEPVETQEFDHVIQDNESQKIHIKGALFVYEGKRIIRLEYPIDSNQPMEYILKPDVVI